MISPGPDTCSLKDVLPANLRRDARTVVSNLCLRLRNITASVRATGGVTTWPDGIILNDYGRRGSAEIKLRLVSEDKQMVSSRDLFGPDGVSATQDLLAPAVTGAGLRILSEDPPLPNFPASLRRHRVGQFASSFLSAASAGGAPRSNVPSFVLISWHKARAFGKS